MGYKESTKWEKWNVANLNNLFLLSSLKISLYTCMCYEKSMKWV